ncbi:MAG TPA: hypothetical protein VGB82_10960 [Alphaproteobacteria bacterium]
MVKVLAILASLIGAMALAAGPVCAGRSGGHGGGHGGHGGHHGGHHGGGFHGQGHFSGHPHFFHHPFVVGGVGAFYYPYYPYYPDYYYYSAYPSDVVVVTTPLYAVPLPGECRPFQGNAVFAGSTQPFYGTACFQADGVWHILR